MAIHAVDQPEEFAELVDDLGLLMEDLGLTRMAGRTLGQLMVGNKPLWSQAELAHALHASVASISVALRQLIQLGMVEKVNVRGLRSDHYRVSASGWALHLEGNLPRYERFRQLAERGLELMEKTGHGSLEGLEGMRDYFAFWEEELPALIERFAKWKARR